MMYVLVNLEHLTSSTSCFSSYLSHSFLWMSASDTVHCLIVFHEKKLTQSFQTKICRTHLKPPVPGMLLAGSPIMSDFYTL